MPNPEKAAEPAAQPVAGTAEPEHGAEQVSEAKLESGDAQGREAKLESGGAKQESEAKPDVKAAPDRGTKPINGAKNSRTKAWQGNQKTSMGAPSQRFVGENYPVSADQFNEAIRLLVVENGDYPAAKRLFDDMICLGYTPQPRVRER